MIEIRQTEEYASWFERLRDRMSKTTVWDAAGHLKTKEDMAAYITCALEKGDSALIAAALGDIARAQGMTKIAKKTGLGRESLYKTLSRDGNPELNTILKVVDAIGLKLKAVPGGGDSPRRKRVRPADANRTLTPRRA